MRNSLPLRTAAAALPLGLLAGCGVFGGSGGSGGGDAAGGDGAHLNIAVQFTPRAGYALETDDAFVLTQVGCLETLVQYDAESGELVPQLATEWTQTSPTEWDFTLRDDVTFQDGSDFDADSVVQSLEHVLEAEVPPRAFTPEAVASVSALDASTVRITTPQPSALLPYRVAAVNTGILADAAYAGDAIDPIGNCTGPFTPVSETPQQSMELERNDAWWGGDVTLGSVTAKFLPDGAARAAQVRTGESDVALGLPSASVAELEGDGDITVSNATTPRTTGLYFNTTRAPFDDEQVRRAVQLAIDTTAISDSVYSGTVVPAFGPFSQDEPWAPQDVEPVTADPEAARQMLAEAGYAEGDLSVTLLSYTERPEFGDLAAVIQEQLRAVGITVQVESSDYAGIEPSLLDNDYDLSLLSRNHLTDIADPIGFLEADYTCEGGYNITGWCDEAFDNRLDEANSMDEATDRNAVYAELAAQLQEVAATTFLVTDQTIAASRSGVVGFVDDPLARYAVTADLGFED